MKGSRRRTDVAEKEACPDSPKWEERDRSYKPEIVSYFVREGLHRTEQRDTGTDGQMDREREREREREKEREESFRVPLLRIWSRRAKLWCSRVSTAETGSTWASAARQESPVSVSTL
jgi:hypothetical protein